GRKNITVNISNFIPKPHTPFQWTQQLPQDEISRRQKFLKDRLGPLKIKFKWQDCRVSEIEGIFARGDRRLFRIVEKAYRLGCYLDGWSEFFKYELWREALSDKDFQNHPLNLTDYDFSTILPWDHIQTGINKDYLREEYKKSLEFKLTPDCRAFNCNNCGVCNKDFLNEIPPLPGDISVETKTTPKILDKEQDIKEKKVRIFYEKRGKAKFLSHLEIMGIFHRAIKKAGIEVIYSKGFHPLPRFSFSQALPVGIESNCEYFDIRLSATEDIKRVEEKMNRCLIKGIKIISVTKIGFAKMQRSDIVYKYLIFLDNLDEDNGLSILDMQNYIAVYNRSEEIPFSYTKKEKSKLINLKDVIREMKAKDNSIEMIVDTASGITIRPWEVLEKILHFSPGLINKVRILKTSNI
ncbi:MAG: TIGR03936 family radical SAM-associated protein, partial [Thermodesulfobacteriota bacterium]|nr:TIGR03936 family radical SAM-associated protein [Thermodesulfobacteriota bacterium]